jgi:hypothetical protein
MTGALLTAGEGGLCFGDLPRKGHGDIKRMQPKPAIGQILKREGAGGEACQRAEGIA